MELDEYSSVAKKGAFAPPFVPSWGIEPLCDLCKKAIGWDLAGFKEKAGELAHFLLSCEKFLPLWCPEGKFDESELEALFAKVKEIAPLEATPPSFAPQILKSFAFEAAFQLACSGSMGVVRAGNVEIRAFGPQPLPLSDSSLFGIGGGGIDGWAPMLALPEVWVKTNYAVKDEECHLALQFVGVQPEAPLAFVFYVKAPSCRVSNQILRPKVLTRFQNEGKVVEFNHVAIQSSLTHKLQIIPLAGAGSFWNCDFLVAFEVHPMAPQMNFSIVAK